MRQQTAILVLLAAILGLGLWWWSRDLAPAPLPVAGTSTSTPAALEAGGVPVPPDEQQRTAAEPTLAVDVAAQTVAVPSPEELWGRVIVAGSGAPVAGADVTLRHRDADEFRNLDLEYGKRVETVGETKSAADGTFRFAVSRALRHQLFVQAAGFAPVTLTNLSGGSEVLVEMKRGAAIEGFVRCGGQGLVDVPIKINVVGENVTLAQGRTAAGGAFSFAELQPREVFVQVKSSQHSEQWKQLALEPGKTHRVEIELDPGKTLRGRVVEATTGLPVVDAEVSDSWTFDRVARTGLDGRFELAGIEVRGFLSVKAKARGYASAFADVTGKLFEVVELRLVRGGEVVGRVVDDAGAPLARAYVACAADYAEGPGQLRCDWIRAEVGADGRFVALGLRPELQYWLHVRSTGKGTRVYALSRKLGGGERCDVGDLMMLGAGSVEGRVVDHAGTPVTGVEVTLQGANDDGLQWCAGGAGPSPVNHFAMREAKTSATGAFRFAGVSAGTYEVSVWPEWRPSPTKREVRAQDGAVVEVDLLVERGLSITGRLTFSDGREPGDAAASMHLKARSPIGQGSWSTAQVMADGRFVLLGLDPGECTVSLSGAPKGWSFLPRLHVVAGTVDLQLVLEPASFVAGRVVDGGGKATKAIISVAFEGEDVSSGGHVTDDEGRFRIEVSPSFRGVVMASRMDNQLVQTRQENVEAGRDDLVFELPQR